MRLWDYFSWSASTSASCNDAKEAASSKRKITQCYYSSDEQNGGPKRARLALALDQTAANISTVPSPVYSPVTRFVDFIQRWVKKGKDERLPSPVSALGHRIMQSNSNLQHKSCEDGNATCSTRRIPLIDLTKDSLVDHEENETSALFSELKATSAVNGSVNTGTGGSRRKVQRNTRGNTQLSNKHGLSSDDTKSFTVCCSDSAAISRPLGAVCSRPSADAAMSLGRRNQRRFASNNSPNVLSFSSAHGRLASSQVLHQVVDIEERNRYRHLLESSTCGAVTFASATEAKKAPNRRAAKQQKRQNVHSVENMKVNSLERGRSNLEKGQSLLSQLSSKPSNSSVTPSLPERTPQLVSSAVGFRSRTSRESDLSSASHSRESQSNSSAESSVRKLSSEFSSGDWNNKLQLDAYFSVLANERKRAEALERELELREQARQEKDRQRNDEILLRLRLEGLTIPEAEEEEGEEFPELNNGQMDMVENAWSKALGPAEQVLVDAFNLRIMRKDLRTLSGTHWLNDEVIFFYMNLLMERAKTSAVNAEGKKKMGKSAEPKVKVYAFNTFFYTKLKEQGYKSISRWTRKFDLFGYDILLVPVHLGVHWCLACIDLRDKSIVYYDSMGGRNDHCLELLRDYIQAEHTDKKKTPLDTTDWHLSNNPDIPQQMNGSDCGMFACKFAEYLSRDAEFTFTQDDMPYFRRRMTFEILTKTLL